MTATIFEGLSEPEDDPIETPAAESATSESAIDPTPVAIESISSIVTEYELLHSPMVENFIPVAKQQILQGLCPQGGDTFYLVAYAEALRELMDAGYQINLEIVDEPEPVSLPAPEPEANTIEDQATQKTSEDKLLQAISLIQSEADGHVAAKTAPDRSDIGYLIAYSKSLLAAMRQGRQITIVATPPPSADDPPPKDLDEADSGLAA